VLEAHLPQLAKFATQPAIELSDKSWVLAAQVPGLRQLKAKRSVEPTAEALLGAIEGGSCRVSGW
jgi:transposase